MSQSEFGYITSQLNTQQGFEQINQELFHQFLFAQQARVWFILVKEDMFVSILELQLKYQHFTQFKVVIVTQVLVQDDFQVTSHTSFKNG